MSEKDLCYFNWNLTKTFDHAKIEHLELPSNLLQKYRYININNPSYYDLHLFTADPETGAFIQPFQIIPQNSLLSFEIPTEMTHNGLFILPIFNNNNSVKYEKRAFLQFSQNNNGWDYKGKILSGISDIEGNVYKYSSIIMKDNDTLVFVTDGFATYYGDEFLPNSTNIDLYISFYVTSDIPKNTIVFYTGASATSITDDAGIVKKGWNNILSNSRNLYYMGMNDVGGVFHNKEIEAVNFKIKALS